MKTHRTQSRQNRLRRQCTLICAAALVIATEANSADDPSGEISGTNLRISRETGQRVHLEAIPGHLPRVAVFLPTPVGSLIVFRTYSMEWTADGQIMPPPGFSKYKGGCYEGAASSYSCLAWHAGFNGKPIRVDVQEAFALNNLEWATRYCFHFKDQFTNWTEYSCVLTPPAPPLPVAPGKPQLTPIPASSGRGADGQSHPFQVLVEWNTNRDDNTDGYEVELQKYDQWPKWNGPDNTGRPQLAGNPTEFEKIVEFAADADPDEVYTFRVCAYNLSGRSCSPLARTPGRAWLERAPAGGKASRFPAPEGSDTFDPNTPAAIPAGPIIAGGRVTLPQSSGPSLSKCDAAQVARARNSPAAPGLEAQCRAEQEAAGLASIGATIAAADPVVAAARAANADPSYQFGFDIATGIFGNPALGAQGNTATGPGSMAIRNGLGDAGRKGFDAAGSLHLGPNYKL